MYNYSAGTTEITTLPGDVAVFNSMGKDKDICLSLSPKPRFPKMIRGYPASQQPSGPGDWNSEAREDEQRSKCSKRPSL